MKISRTLAENRHKVSLSEQAYLLLRNQILRGVFPPTAVLSRRRLAAEFGMSLLPISEALKRLESDGLVESRSRVGTRVRTPTLEEVQGRYVVREALEVQAARLCCEVATFQERLELRTAGDHLDTLFARAAVGEKNVDFLFVVHTHHLNFHMRIAEYTRCKELRNVIERNQVLIFNWFYHANFQMYSLPPRFHHELADVIAGSDPYAADEAMRKHVRYGLSELVRTIQIRTAEEWRNKRAKNNKPVRVVAEDAPRAGLRRQEKVGKGRVAI
jgi:DNA-binding GntR family transcriptional regulator